jgi:hypothetical protein
MDPDFGLHKETPEVCSPTLVLHKEPVDTHKQIVVVQIWTRDRS